MNQPQTTALTTTNTTNNNQSMALQSAWQQEWLTAYNALPVKAASTAAAVCALQTVAPAVSVINRGAADMQAGIDVFMAELVRITRLMGTPWNDYQLETSAELLYADYYHWTFAELKHFTLRVMKADFKCQKDFTKLNPKHIMLCAAEHDNGVIEARMDYNRYAAPAASHTKEAQYIPPGVLEEAMAAWRKTCAHLKDQLIADRDAEEARMRTERDQQEEALFRQYCKAQGLDYEQMRKEVCVGRGSYEKRV